MIGFVYRNSREKRIATTRRPAISLGSGQAVVRQGAYTFSAEL
jgi:predicted RNA-binding protein (virulence factor B family)